MPARPPPSPCRPVPRKGGFMVIKGRPTKVRSGEIAPSRDAKSAAAARAGSRASHSRQLVGKPEGTKPSCPRGTERRNGGDPASRSPAVDGFRRALAPSRGFFVVLFSPSTAGKNTYRPSGAARGRRACAPERVAFPCRKHVARARRSPASDQPRPPRSVARPPLFPQVIEVTTQGRQARPRYATTATDIFTGKKMEELVPSSHNLEVPSCRARITPSST